jgi:molybdopterin-guanine dinucleotide biosynthesis protein A
MQASLLVLAGGDSRRMGRPKAWLEVGDTYLLRYVAERLAPAFSEVMVSFAEPEQLEEPVPYRVVFDRRTPAGPLAGLEAGLAAARNDMVFAVACDMPYVDGRPEPVCGAYRRSALPFITGAVNAGRFRAADLSAELDVTWLEDLDPLLFRSLNTPQDLERFHAEFAPQR